MFENSRFQRAMFCLFAALVVVLLGCGSISGTPIEKILNNPREYDGRMVTVSGEVEEVFSLVFIKYFTVRDKTGEITIITERPIPKKGSQVTVSGTVREAFSIGDKQLIVLVEQDNAK